MIRGTFVIKGEPFFRGGKWGQVGSSVTSNISCLQNLRAEFAVAHSAADFHFWPNCCDCADDFPSSPMVNAMRLLHSAQGCRK